MVGFLEGEGGFYLMHEKGVKPLTPFVSIYNTDRTPLEFIQKTLTTYSIKSNIYHWDPKPEKRYAQKGPRKRCYRLTVLYRENCIPLMRLLDGKIVARYKQEQFRLWKEAMLAREKEIANNQLQMADRNEMVMRRVAEGEDLQKIANELGLKRSTLYVMLFRHGLTVGKLRGGESR